jgi:outer membrane protein OmpA-like peptidoglycan-associated protein
MEIKVNYIAKGGERFLTFGNFKSNSKTKMIKTGENLKNSAYYYIDMISVVKGSQSFNKNEIYVLEGLNFDHDNIQIKDESLKKLKLLVEYLKENPSLILTINGHTDSKGDKDYNRELSAKRAKTVGKFLIDNGLSPFRIAWNGYGASKPIMANKTEEGREKNRRVEFIISKRNREFYASGVFEDDDNE